MDKTESETLEFKRSLSDFDSILATISAFANTRGGRILIGVDDDGKVVGVYIGRGTLEELVNKISQNTQPKIYPEIKVSKINGKQIIEIIVTERSDKPVFAKGHTRESEKAT
jgi:ATP-dependent DNA helicase RecG